MSRQVETTSGEAKNQGPEEMLEVRDYVARYSCCRAEEIGVEKLTGDASTRQYFRTTLPDGRSFIVARYPEPFDPISHSYCDVTKLFLVAGLPVPRLLDVNGDRAMMLQEDLGDVRLQDWLPSATDEDCRLAYREAVDLIVRIQRATQLAYDRESAASRLAFDVEKLSWELRYFSSNFFEKYLQSPLATDLAERVQGEFVQMASELAAAPRVLTHRDFHSRNLMLFNGRQYIIDHQDARMGPPSYDVASLLGDPYVELDDELVEEMIAYFLESKSRDSGDPLDAQARSEFMKEYDLMAAQRLLKATGTYAYQTAVVGNQVYVPYIPRSLSRAIRAMERLNRFPAIRQALDVVAGRW
jgi:hypothetical protein